MIFLFPSIVCSVIDSARLVGSNTSRGLIPYCCYFGYIYPRPKICGTSTVVTPTAHVTDTRANGRNSRVTGPNRNVWPIGVYSSTKGRHTLMNTNCVCVNNSG